MKLAVMLAAIAASAFALAGCGGDDSTEAVTTTETVATAPTETTTTTDTTTTTTTTPAAQAKVITVRVVGGQPQGGIERPTIEQGDKVVLVVRTDSGEAVHLHGYNIEKDGVHVRDFHATVLPIRPRPMMPRVWPRIRLIGT